MLEGIHRRRGSRAQRTRLDPSQSVTVRGAIECQRREPEGLQATLRHVSLVGSISVAIQSFNNFPTNWTTSGRATGITGTTMVPKNASSDLKLNGQTGIWRAKSPYSARIFWIAS